MLPLLDPQLRFVGRKQRHEIRVLQNLETDTEVDGLFRCIQRHLAPNGACILNVFHPMYDPDTLRQKWVVPGEKKEWETPVEGGKITCSSRRLSMGPPLVLIQS
jgi:hypothetical protein